jgi:HEAT repeat protein
MTEKPDKVDEVKKLLDIAKDLGLSSGVRIKAVDAIGSIGTHDALLALLDLAANESLIKNERDRALKHARKIIKSGY